MPQPGQARAIQIDLDPMRIGLWYPVEVCLNGDSRRSLQLLLPLVFGMVSADIIEGRKSFNRSRQHKEEEYMMNTRRKIFDPLKRMTAMSIITASLVFLTACERQTRTGQTQEQEAETYGAPDRAGESEGVEVTVEQPPPRVIVDQPAPRVTVEQQEPRVTVDQPEPIIHVQQGEPEVQVRQQGEPQIRVQQQGEQDQSEQDQQLQQDQSEQDPQLQQDQPRQ